MADIITREHLKGLHLFDWALAGGPDYAKLAVQGAVVGGVLSLVMGRPWERGNFAHTAKYGLGGAAVAVVGVTALFGIGKLVSERSHEAVAEAVTRGEFEGGEYYEPQYEPLEY
jgi:ABC-type Fe3+ transport system substrate-binding protein